MLVFEGACICMATVKVCMSSMWYVVIPCKWDVIIGWHNLPGLHKLSTCARACTSGDVERDVVILVMSGKYCKHGAWTSMDTSRYYA